MWCIVNVLCYVDLRLYIPWFDVCWSFGVVGFEWYPCCRLKHHWSVQPSTRIPLKPNHTESPTNIESSYVQSQIHNNSQYQQKCAYQLQQSDKARHIKHTPLSTIIYTNVKYSVFTEQDDQRGNSTE